MQAKHDFRQRWAAINLDGIRKTKLSKTQGWRRIDRTKGTLRSLKWLTEHEGAADAHAYARKCVCLGGSWVSYDEMWERPTYLVLTEEHIGEFTKSWQEMLEHEEEHSQATTSLAAAPSPSSSGSGGVASQPSTTGEPNATGEPAAPVPAPKAKGSAKALGKRKRGEENGGTDDPSPKKEKEVDPSKKVISNANKTKDLYLSSTSGGANLLAVVSSNSQWAWANNEHAKHDLLQAQSRVQDAVRSSPFAQEFVTLKSGIVRSNYKDDAAWLRELAAFTTLLEGPCKQLAKETSTMVAMHAARK